MNLMMKEYRVTSPFGPRKSPITGRSEFHTGIDLVKPPYSEIVALVPGKVVHAKEGISGTGVGGFGITVIIQDKYDHFHIYAHLSSCCVKVGQAVQSRQVVGKQGNTGKSAGQHLHYEVRKNGLSFGFGKHVDPVKYLDDYFAKEKNLAVEKASSPPPKPVTPKTCAIQFNGSSLTVRAFLEGGKSYIPVRAFAEELGHPEWVEWCDSRHLIVLKDNYVESTKFVNGTGYAASREVSNYLDFGIEWDSVNQVVNLERLSSNG